MGDSGSLRSVRGTVKAFDSHELRDMHHTVTAVFSRLFLLPQIGQRECLDILMNYEGRKKRGRKSRKGNRPAKAEL